MDFNTIKRMLSERTLTKKELKKREEIAKAIEKDNPGIEMGKKMAIATATAKKCCINEISQYDLVVTYLRHIGMDPYRLKGPNGNVIRERIKNSPAYQNWVKTRYNEEYQTLEDNDFYIAEKKVDKLLKARKKVKNEIQFFGIDGIVKADNKSPTDENL